MTYFMWPSKEIALTEPAVSKELSVGELLNIIEPCGEKYNTPAKSET